MPGQKDKKRKRGLDDDTVTTVVPRRSKRLAGLGSKETGIEALPSEIFDRILREVALDGNERAAAKNLTAIEMVGKSFQKELRASPAGQYRQSLTETGKAAKRNYAMLPSGKFREGGPVTAEEYVDMVGPGIHLLTPDEQSNVVDKIVGVTSAWRRADALNKMASYSDGLYDHNRSRLLDSAIDLIEQQNGTHTFHACKAIAKLYDYRNQEQETRIAAVRNRDPLTGTTIDGELDAIRRLENTSTVENTPSPSAEAGGSNGYTPVRQRVRNATEDVRAKVRQGDTARADLKKTMRERDGRG